MASEIIVALRQIIVASLGWIFGYPLTLLLRRDPDFILITSRPGKFFSDNSKYFFAYTTQSAKTKEKVVFLTTDKYIQTQISEAGGTSLLYPSLSSIWALLRCGIFVTDWFGYSIYPLTRGALFVQIWHGAPLKYIELDVYRERLKALPRWFRGILKLQKTVIGRYPTYDVVVATSQWFIENAFKRSFKARKFNACGYPRNDILLGCPEPGGIAERLIRINVDQQVMRIVRNAKFKGKRVCLYVPTFRKGLKEPFTEHVDLRRFSNFAVDHNIIVILKLHPLMHGRYVLDKYPNLIEYSPICDIYPIMPLCDMLVTDYSSIYFDFLLLDKPIIFFSYDLCKYLNEDRNMYFDYDVITPGLKSYTYEDLESNIELILSNQFNDACLEKRLYVKSLVHDVLDNKSSDRLLNFIRNMQSELR